MLKRCLEFLPDDYSIDLLGSLSELEKISASSLSNMVNVRGRFSETCDFYFSKSLIENIRADKTKIIINQLGDKPIINNAQIVIADFRGRVILNIGNDDAIFVLGEYCSGNYDIRLWRNSRVLIGKKTSSNGTVMVCDKSEILIGEDCMFSDDILLQSSDQHGIVDIKAGNIINNVQRRIRLGNHVWIGRRAILMPDVEVGAGSIVGAGSVVTHAVAELSIAAGNPARIIKTGYTWSRSHSTLDDYSRNIIGNRENQ